MADPLRHRQTKGAATGMVDLTPPRHIPTLPKAGISPSAVRCAVVGGPSPPTNDSLNRPRSSLTSCMRAPAWSRPMEQQDGARVSTAYLRFAEDEVRDKSPLYGEVLRGVASDQ